MIGGRSALLSAARDSAYHGNWTGNYEDVVLLLRGYEGQESLYNEVSLLLRGASSSGTIPLDESPSPKIITIAGNAGTTTALSKYGGTALGFDGSGDYLATPYVNGEFDWWTSYSGYTIEAWVYATSWTGWSASNGRPCMIGNMKPNTTESYWMFGPISNGRLMFWWFDGAVKSLTTTATIPLSQWNHIALVINGTIIKLYINGVESASATGTGLSDASWGFTIGQYNNTSINGYIDDLRITRYARYTSGFTVPLEASATAEGDSSVLAILDESPAPKSPLDEGGNVQISTAVSRYGGSSIAFDGNGDRLVASPSTDWDFSGGPHTTECWLYLNSLPTQICRVVMAGPNAAASSMVLIEINQSGQVSMVRPLLGSTRLASPTLLSSNQWYHIATVINGSNSAVFVNGVGTFGPITLPTSIATNQLFIGYDTAGGSVGSNLNGYIDDLRITKGVARYTEDFLPPPAELPAI